MEIVAQKKYMFDMDKIKTIEDIKLVLSAMDLHFDKTIPNFSEVEHLIKDVPKNELR